MIPAVLSEDSVCEDVSVNLAISHSEVILFLIIQPDLHQLPLAQALLQAQAPPLTHRRLSTYKQLQLVVDARTKLTS